jgi:hypothetical protein
VRVSKAGLRYKEINLSFLIDILDRLSQSGGTPLLKVFVTVLLLLALAFAGVAFYGSFRWEAGTKKLRDRLDAARVSVEPQVVNFDEINGLPDPVQKYFCKALKEGQSMVTDVSMRHRGTFNLSGTTEQWKLFTSEQRVVTQRPGFDWNGRISVLPGLPVLVHDAYANGEGMLLASLLGLFSLASIQGKGAIAEGELMRFLAEAAWYPTALLPSQGIRWVAVSDRFAQGTLTDGDVSVTLLFTFNEQNLIETVQADARGRTVGDQVIPTPWYGRFWNYKERNGMQIPFEGEVAWVLPEGAKPYWRGSLTEISYQYL